MRSVREAIRAILMDDALYKRKDLPGDVDDPPEESGCGCGGQCQSCSDQEDFVTPKYALYTMIGDAIEMYDSLQGESLESDSADRAILEMAKNIRSMKIEY